MRNAASLSGGRIGNPHIGRPIANTRMYILDGHGNRFLFGVAGERISRGGVARGYLKPCELTAEKFLKDPFIR